jgi:hypothetical protein
MLDWDATHDANELPDLNFLNFAWQVRGPSADDCRDILLNCSDPTQMDQLVSLDPEESLGDPHVGCFNNDTRVLRIFYGHNCKLWRPILDGTGCF